MVGIFFLWRRQFNLFPAITDNRFLLQIFKLVLTDGDGAAMVIL